MKVNKPQIFKELDVYSFEIFKEIFGENEENTEKIINKLISQNILKKLNNIPKSELEDLLEIEIIDDVENYEKKYIFKYVGIIMVGDSILIVYPKYIDEPKDDKGFLKLKQIIKVLAKYKKNRKQEIGLKGDKKENSFNILAYALDIIEDYHLNGIYRNNKEIIEINGNGEALWSKTVNETIPIFNDEDEPVYHEIFTVNQEIDKLDFFRRLHLSILSEVSNKIENILSILDIDIINESTENLKDFGDKEYLIYKLEQEGSIQYIDREKRKLNNMLIYINKSKINQDAENISFFGTTAFNLVWEDVCSVSLDNSLNKSLHELGLTTDSKTKLIDIIPKPKWKDSESQKSHRTSKTLKPDLINIDKENKEIIIYDAKYYRIIFNENGIKKQPGVGDVTKQHLYEIAYKKLAEQYGFNIKMNAFILPTDSKEERVLGEASMTELFYGLECELNPIQVIEKPCEYMYNEYLKK